MKYFTLAISIALISTSSYLITSCSSDFELNAPYNSTPVIFGILDQSTDTQYVKINKSFIGNGDNESYAAINDSSIYSNVVGRVEEYVDDVLANTFTLEEKWKSNLDAGIFYTDSQKVFFFVPPFGLDENAIYKLIVDVAEEAEPITAETELIKGDNKLIFNSNFTGSAQNSGLSFTTKSGWTEDKYQSLTPKWLTVENGKRYELTMKLHFIEVTSTSSQSKYIEWGLGTQISTTTSKGNSMIKRIDGETFYQTMANKLEGYAYEADVLKRKIGRMEFTLTAANDNLNTFIEINEPSTGIVTEKPVFSNIESGVGIFASRYSYSTDSLVNTAIIYLDAHTTKALVDGPYTSGYKFCVDPAINQYNVLTEYSDLACP